MNKRAQDTSLLFRGRLSPLFKSPVRVPAVPQGQTLLA
jgi:hypothetical protein